MRNFLFSSAIALFCWGFFSQCTGGGGKTPESVAINFLKSFAAFDFAKAKKYCTEDAQQVVGFMESMLGMVSAEEKEEFKKKTAEDMKDLKKANCRIENDLAYCKVCCDENGKESDDEPLRLKKVEGKWLVDMSKEDLNMGGGN